jgi:BirA family biotin operon repressor/biotin-[acetyl-CoA-carboxylase] ligase
MYLSAALLPRWPQGLSLLGAKALLRLVESFGLRGKLRWPNDVTLEGRKIGGVLPVARYQGNALERAILGVGLNVCQPLQAFPAELRPSLTTLALACPGTDWDVPKVARAYLRALEVEMADLEQHGLARLSRACEPYLEGLGDGRLPVLVTPDQRHQSLPPVAGLSPTGALLLEGGEVLDTLGRDQRLRFSDEP